MYFGVFFVGYCMQLFNKKILFWIFATLISLMAFLRYGVGLDYFGYQWLYERLQTSVINEFKYGLDHQEIGFRLIGSALKSVGLSYQWYLVIFAAVTVWFVAKICKEYSKNPTLSLLIYFSFYYLTWAYTGIRQGVVLAIGIYFLLKFLEQSKPLKYFFIVLTLSLIHSSAWMLLLLYLASKVNFKKGHLYLIAAVSVALSVIPTGFLISKMTFIPFYWRLYPYLNTDVSLNMFDFQSLGRLAFLFIAFYCYDAYSKQSEFSKKIINLYIISLSMYFFLQFSELSAARLSIYGQFLDIIILANLIYLYKKPLDKLLYIYGVFVICFIFLFKHGTELERGFTSSEKSYLLTPYVHIFNKDDFHFSSDYVQLVSR